MVDGDSNRTNPGVVWVVSVGNKESIHLQLAVADHIEGGALLSLEGVAEQTSFR